MKKIILLVLFTIVCNTLFAQRVANVRFEGKTGFLNEDGSWLLEPVYEKGRNFSDGVVAVLKDDKWGYIDAKGAVVIPFIYEKAKEFNKGIALVFINNKWRYITKDGKEIYMPLTDKKYNFDNNGVAFIKRKQKIGLIDLNGTILIEPKYDKILKFKNGYAKVLLKKSWGLIAANGNVILEPEFDFIGTNSDGLIPVKKNKVWSLFKDGEFIEINDVVSICDFIDGEPLTCAYLKKNKAGFIDRKGNWVIEPVYKSVKQFSNGMAGVRVNDWWRFINAKGEVTINSSYYDVGHLDNDGFIAVRNKNLWGFINSKGEKAVDFKYFFIPGSDVAFRNYSSNFVNGIVRVRYKGNWGFINVKDELIGGVWFQNAEKFVEIYE